MQQLNDIKATRALIEEWHQAGYSIGFVPTMGYLHEGHQSLITRAAAENDKVIVSVFVNPLQFGPEEDYDSYPRDLKGDQQRAAQAGADLLFAPTVAQMYPEGFDTFVTAYGVTDKLEGATRPGHFCGVTTVVAKLFNILQPQRAYFGQKDAQQVAVIRQMVRDLNMPVTIIPCPIIREADGLAKSSRNTYLTAAEYQAALSLSQSLKLAETLIQTDNIVAVEQLKKAMTACFSSIPLARIDYIKIVDPISLEELAVITDSCLILLAAYIGKTRLIDNLLIEGRGYTKKEE